MNGRNGTCPRAATYPQEARGTIHGTVLIAPAGHAQVPIIRSARARGLRVIAMDAQPAAPGLKLADVGLAIDPATTRDATEALRSLGVDAVLCAGHDPSLIPMSALARSLGLAGIPEETLRICRYKHLARAWLDTHCPSFSTDYAVVRASQELHDAWRRIGPDVVLKPVDGCGSRGVVVVRRAEDLDWAHAQAVAFSACGLVIVERFLQGKEVTVDAFVMNGRYVPVAVTERLLGPEPYRVLIGHIHPATLSLEEAAQLHAAVSRVVGEMGVESGPVHAEWILTDDGPRMLELVYRLGGGCLSAGLLPVGCGVDFVGAAIAQALGETPDVEPLWNRAVCLRFVTKPFPGRLTPARERLAALSPGVVDVRFWDRDGIAADAGVNSACRAGWVIAKGDCPTSSRANAERALDAMGIRAANGTAGW